MRVIVMVMVMFWFLVKVKGWRRLELVLGLWLR